MSRAKKGKLHLSAHREHSKYVGFGHFGLELLVEDFDALDPDV